MSCSSCNDNFRHTGFRDDHAIECSDSNLPSIGNEKKKAMCYLSRSILCLIIIPYAVVVYIKSIYSDDTLLFSHFLSRGRRRLDWTKEFVEHQKLGTERISQQMYSNS